jgi:multiple sugar transport system permease protein
MGNFSHPQFVGLDNYATLFARIEFWDSLRVTLIFVIVSTLGALLLGAVLARFLNQKFVGRGLYMALLLLPVISTPVVSGLMWKYMLNPDSGVINYLISLAGLKGPLWLARSSSALVAICLVEIWQWAPFIALLLLAGLQTIPAELYDAARVDGANPFRVLVNVVLPQLSSVILAASLLRLIDAFKSFDTIYVMTAGGPGRGTQVFNILTYYTGFRYFEFGRAAALCIVCLVILTILAQLLLRGLAWRTQSDALFLKG